ncbi:lipoprotein [Paraburkholderia acidicola]|uniref:Lipoprotein n=1 Tax=Paraburkholderia acidicola TaxID=1912599 RepID=A0ABV1LL63_9BURK
MRVVFRMSAIVAALAILAGGALSGCGQRGALYMPVVPPLPPKPVEQTQQPNADAASPAQTGSIPDTSGTPLSLSPDTQLSNPPASDAVPASAASSVAPSTPLPASSGTQTTE